METYCLFDMSNILHKTYYAHVNEKIDDLTALAYHTSFITLNKYHKLYKPTQTIFVFDRSSWRKEYTKTDLCYSGKVYKGQRRQKMTPRQKQRYELFLEFINDFEQLMRKHTGIVCLAGDKLEADDLIAGFTEAYSGEDKIVIISADKDLLQLLQFPNVELIDPATGKNRTLEEWNNDVNFYLYSKCLRGDIGDNIQSAYPRIRSSRIKETYEDLYKRVNMMNETWTNHEGKEMVVKDVFEENQLLMDLTKQPTCVRRKIFETIEQEINNPGKFSYFHFLQFLGKYQLKNVTKNFESFIPMLSG